MVLVCPGCTTSINDHSEKGQLSVPPRVWLRPILELPHESVVRGWTLCLEHQEASDLRKDEQLPPAYEISAGITIQFIDTHHDFIALGLDLDLDIIRFRFSLWIRFRLDLIGLIHPQTNLYHLSANQ